jgi:hypothetical protein
MDQRILYSDPWALRDMMAPPGSDPATGDVDTELLTEMFRHRLGRIFARLLLEDDPSLAEAWSTNTDREIDYVKPRLAENPYDQG